MPIQINNHQHSTILAALNLLHATLTNDGSRAIRSQMDECGADIDLQDVDALIEAINCGDLEGMTPPKESDYLIKYRLLNIDSGVENDSEFSCLASSPVHAMQQLYEQSMSRNEMILGIQNPDRIYPPLFQGTKGEWILAPTSGDGAYIDVGPGCVWLNMEKGYLQVHTVHSGGDVVSEISEDFHDLYD